MNLGILIIGIAILSLIMFLDIKETFSFCRLSCNIPVKNFPINDALPPISVVIPCKGDQGGCLANNLETLVRNSDSRTEFIFATALANDPAQAVLKQFCNAHPELRLKVVVAGIHPYGCEKNNNLLKAIEAANPNSEIFVFLDSDGNAGGQFVRKLVSGFENGIVAVTGFNWYEPRWHVLPDVIRTVHTAVTMGIYADPRITAVAGSSMAIRRKTFEEADIPTLWGHSITDDDSLSVRLGELGLKTRFMPNCVVLNSQTDSWASLLQWEIRTTLLTRLSVPGLFAMYFLRSVAGHVLGYGFLLWGLTLGFRDAGVASTVIGLLWVAHSWICGYLLIAPIEKCLQASEIDVKLHRLRMILVMPLVSLLQLIASVCCLFMKRIMWAGITYEIKNQIARRVS